MLLLPAPALGAPIPITGHLLGPSGQPLAGAGIELISLAAVQGTRPAATAKSDPAGRFRLVAPEAGMWKVVVRAPGSVPRETHLVPLVEAADLPLETVWHPSGRKVQEALRGTSLSGRVVQNGNRRPISGALVWPDGHPEAFVRSGQDGSWSLAAVALGEVKLRAAAPGHLQAERLVKTPATAGPELVLVSRPADEQSVVGRVLDESGRPVAGGRVSLIPAATPGNNPFSQRASQAKADSQGQFRLTLSSAGIWDLRAEAPGFIPTTVRGLAIRPGRIPVDLGGVVLRTGAILDGKTVDSAGDPVAGARIQVISADPISDRFAAAEVEEDAEILTQEDGGFSIPSLLPGAPVTVRVSREGYLPATLRDIQVPALEPIRVVLSPASRITGRVVDESGDPIAQAQAVITRDTTRQAEGGNAASRATGKDGRFAVEGVAPGTAILTAVAPGYLPAERRKIEIGPGRDVEGLEIVLRHGAIIEGKVLTASGRPVADARVRLERRKLAPGEPPLLSLLGLSEAITGKDGSYQLEGIPEGSQSVRVEHADHPAATSALEVQPGANRLDLHLEDGFEVAGRAVDSQQRPVPGAAVRLVGASEVYEATAGADGGFRMAGVPAGIYRLEGERAGYAAVRSAKEVRVAGPMSGLALRLDRGATVTGRISGLTFEDLSKVQIGAASSMAGQAGRVDYQGVYRIENLSPGEWIVEAQVPGSDRRALGNLQLEPGQTEAVLDLDLGGGLTLTGVILQGERPLAGIAVKVRNGESGVLYGAVSGPDGTFRVEGLKPGPYSVSAVRQGAEPYTQRVDLVADDQVVVQLASSQ